MMTTDFTHSLDPIPTMDLLFRCLQHDWSAATVADVAALPPATWAALTLEAQQQRVASVLYERISRHQLAPQMPEDLRRQLVAVHQQNGVRNMILYHHLGQLIGDLHAQAIPVILLKGAHLSAVVYEGIALRHMVDADLLVPESALGTAIEIVTALGYQPLYPLVPTHLYLSHRNHLPRFFREGSLSVEIHWTITKPNQRYTIPMTELWARAQQTTVSGIDVATLAPEDLLLHICLHATHQHQLEQGIRFLCDIDVICRHFGPTLDWDAVVARAQAWNWGRGVYLALYLAHELLAVPIPDAVLTALQVDEDIPQLPMDFKRTFASAQIKQTYNYSQNFTAMWENQEMQSKVRLVWQQIFLPRKRLAMKYGTTTTSPKLLWYYGLRLVELFQRYGRTVAAPRQQRMATTAELKRKAALTAWLEN